MSYSTDSVPDDIQLRIIDSRLVLSFTCPRCDDKHACHIDPADFFYEVSVQCDHPKCVGPDERAGYILSMLPLWEGQELGLSDRPLHEP